MELESSKAHRLAYLAALLHTSSNLAVWCFNPQGELYFSTSSCAKELSAFWEIGGCKEYALTEGTRFDTPFVMSDAIGLVWVGEYSNVTENTGRVLVLMGPMFHSETSLKTLEERMRERDLSLSIRSVGRRVLQEVPVLSIPDMNRYIKMLHFSATGATIQPDEIIYQADRLIEAPTAPVAEITKEQHFLDYENSMAREKIIMQCIREGNMNYTQIIGGDKLQVPPDNYKTGDPLREAKDIMIIFLSQCCRAAIDGKLSIKTAKQLEVRYIQQIEQCQRLTDLSNLRHRVLAEYITRVHSLQSMPGVSQGTQACCDYIQAHFMEPIELADIAKSVGYTEYYMTRKFQKEMGIRLWDYIRKVRLDYAKIWLISTEDTIQSISERLHFGTRNHFSRVFKAQEGVTPMEYRECSRMTPQTDSD